ITNFDETLLGKVSLVKLFPKASALTEEGCIFYKLQAPRQFLPNSLLGGVPLRKAPLMLILKLKLFDNPCLENKPRLKLLLSGTRLISLNGFNKKGNLLSAFLKGQTQSFIEVCGGVSRGCFAPLFGTFQ
ncbi:hypothetical protein, partial [Thermococcus sp.]